MTAVPKRLLTSAGLSAFFLLVYGFGQWAAGRRALVPSVNLGWERHVPFVAALIVPYLSIDLFFVSAPFLIRTDRALRTYTLRIVAAIGAAGVCFVLTPLRFAFARPVVAGPLGMVFEQFRQLDPPFNQLPSLHVALLLIVGDVFLRRWRGPVRGLLMGWFALIAVSPLLVYQHHVLDLLAGLALGVLCLQIGPDRNEPFVPNVRVGSYYAAGAAGVVGICLAAGKPAWFLWWPATSLAVVAAGYWWVGPGIYRKRDGRLPWTTQLLLGPTLLGQRASLWWYARRCRPYDRVVPHLLIGRKLSAREMTDLSPAAVVDLTCEFSETVAGSYLSLPTLDLTAATATQLDRAVAFIFKHEPAGVVYVHCKVGYSRSAAVVGAYLLATGRAESVETAIATIRVARPTLIVRPEARRAIEQWWTRRQKLDPMVLGERE